MKFLIAFFALIAISQVGHLAASYLAAPAVVAAPALPIYAQSSIPVTYKVGESHYNYPIPEHRFTRTDYETPGATYAIPAIKTTTLTRPAYTTYLQSAITKSHVTNHQVAGPTIVKPIIAPVVSKALAPISPLVHAAPLLHAAPYSHVASYVNGAPYTHGGHYAHGAPLASYY